MSSKNVLYPQNGNVAPGPSRGMQKNLVGSAGGSFTEHFESNPYAMNLAQDTDTYMVKTFDSRQSLKNFKGDRDPSLPKPSFTVPIDQVVSSLFPTSSTPSATTTAAAAHSSTTSTARTKTSPSSASNLGRKSQHKKNATIDLVDGGDGGDNKSQNKENRHCELNNIVGPGDIIPCVANTVVGISYDIYYWGELPKDVVGGKSFDKKFKYVFCRDSRPFYLAFLVLALLCIICIIKLVQKRVY